jgi:hypothetical protein
MPSAGYSGTPLIQKLGIKPATKLMLVNVPPDYYDLLQADVSRQLCSKNEVPDFIHLFVPDMNSFRNEMKKTEKLRRQNSAMVIWISWYKKSSRVSTDVTEDAIRAYALQHKLVDVKVCAVSEQWSGLKLVVPLASRK